MRHAGPWPPGPGLDSPDDFRTVLKGVVDMAATNINRVILTGNLTRDPEYAAPRSRLDLAVRRAS